MSFDPGLLNAKLRVALKGVDSVVQAGERYHGMFEESEAPFLDTISMTRMENSAQVDG
jgi:hypothetical protein